MINTDNTDNNLRNCTFVKCILMVIVIFGHSIAFWTGQWIDFDVKISCPLLGYAYQWINSFHIYSFALVSGYIFAAKVRRGGYNEFIPFLKNKAKRLLMPYIFAATIWVAPISVGLFNWDLVYSVKKYILCINPSQLWFLWMLFGVFAIVWPMRKILIEKPSAGWLISIVFYGVGIVGKQVFPNIFCIWTACQYVLLFYIGMRVSVKEDKQGNRITESVPWYIWIIADLIIFAGTVLVGRNDGALWNIISIGLNLILHMIGAIMAWTTLQELANKVNWKNSKAFKTFTSYSMPMYLFHQQIIYFTIFWLNGKVNPWINAGVNFVVALICSFLISRILMRWKITRFLIGEK